MNNSFKQLMLKVKIDFSNWLRTKLSTEKLVSGILFFIFSQNN